MDPDPYHGLIDPNPAFFVSGGQDVNKKRFFCLLLIEGTFLSVSIDKKSKRRHKLVEIKGFHAVFAC